MRKQLKPNVVQKTVKGKLYFYYRLGAQVDGKRKEKYLPLPSDPDSAEFDAAYWAIRSGKATRPPVKTTYRALIISYRSSKRFKKLSTGTRRQYDRVINEIEAKNGDKDVTKTTRSEIDAIHEKHAATPRKADWYVQVLRILFNHAIRLEWRTDNPAATVELFGAQRAYKQWPTWFQKAYVAAAADDIDALMIFHLGRGTGQRPGDMAKMEWADFANGMMRVTQEKGDQPIVIYCPLFLQAELARQPRRGRYIFAKNLTQNLSYDALEKKFRKIRQTIAEERPEALDYSLHGLRKLAAVELAEAGCSDAEIQAVTGHKTAAMAAFYRAEANRTKMSKTAQERREQNKSET